MTPKRPQHLQAVPDQEHPAWWYEPNMCICGHNVWRHPGPEPKTCNRCGCEKYTPTIPTVARLEDLDREEGRP